MALQLCTQRGSLAKRNVRYHDEDDWNDGDDWNHNGDDDADDDDDDEETFYGQM